MNARSGTIVVCNDKAALNQRYRVPLMNALEARGVPVSSVGLFERGRPSPSTWFRLAFGRHAGVVSSNLRSNLAVLALPWLRGLVIVNGLGRFRKRRLLRRALLVLLAFNGRKRVAFQNRADFRWACRYSRHKGLAWVPGSGGSSKRIGSIDRCVLVQRDDKLALVADSLHRLYTDCPDLPPVALVGCRDAETATGLMSPVPCDVIGFVPPADILAAGNTFLQPEGYGEGLPHSLADAVVSSMAIVIHRKEFLRYGLGGFGIQPTALGRHWLRFTPNERLREALSQDVVTEQYVALLQEALVLTE